ncbi:hypothetical protein DFJ77DRAFT_195678 [Powellomyces hirtus]|nr:hypothetical protein DFJ77DRAFT_195678 [Powellomyces hirtus]
MADLYRHEDFRPNVSANVLKGNFAGNAAAIPSVPSSGPPLKQEPKHRVASPSQAHQDTANAYAMDFDDDDALLFAADLEDMDPKFLQDPSPGGTHQPTKSEGSAAGPAGTGQTMDKHTNAYLTPSPLENASTYPPNGPNTSLPSSTQHASLNGQPNKSPQVNQRPAQHASGPAVQQNNGPPKQQSALTPNQNHNLKTPAPQAHNSASKQGQPQNQGWNHGKPPQQQPKGKQSTYAPQPSRQQIPGNNQNSIHYKNVSSSGNEGGPHMAQGSFNQDPKRLIAQRSAPGAMSGHQNTQNRSIGNAASANALTGGALQGLKRPLEE